MHAAAKPGWPLCKAGRWGQLGEQNVGGYKYVAINRRLPTARCGRAGSRYTRRWRSASTPRCATRSTRPAGRSSSRSAAGPSGTVLREGCVRVVLLYTTLFGSTSVVLPCRSAAGPSGVPGGLCVNYMSRLFSDTDPIGSAAGRTGSVRSARSGRESRVCSSVARDRRG
jgi:hypothetical protein